MHAAFSDVIEAFGEPLLNQCLGREDKVVAFKLNIQVVSRCKPELVMKLLRDNHLAGYSNLDRCHSVALLKLYFHIFVY